MTDASPSSPSTASDSQPAPKVSVVIATRDRLALLRQAVDAVIAQTYEGVVETIVVFDQNIPDESFTSDDDRRPVRVVSNTHTEGLPGARNSGVEHATGEYLSFCDDDDLFLPSKTATQVEFLSLHGDEFEAVVCGIEVAFKDQPAVARPLDQQVLTFDDLLATRVMQALFQTVMIRRSSWEDIGPDDENIPGGYGEDYEWLLRVAKRGHIGVVPAPLVTIRWSGGSFFANRWRTIDDALAYLLARYPEFERHPAGHARILGQRAFALAASGDRRAGARMALTAARAHPLERRVPLALAVACGLVSADKVVTALNRRGRGI